MQIRNKKNLDKAANEIELLLNKGDSLSPTELLRLERLSKASHDFEESHYPIKLLSGAELLQNLIKINDLTPMRLAKAAGLIPMDLLAFCLGTQDLTTDDKKKLAAYFRLQPSAFNKPPTGTEAESFFLNSDGAIIHLATRESLVIETGSSAVHMGIMHPVSPKHLIELQTVYAGSRYEAACL